MIELGLGRGAIQRAIECGRLRPFYRGVYAVGHSALTADGRRLAAVLACGEGAALSHRTAASLWGLRRSTSARIEVTTPRTGKGIDGIIIHRSRHLPADHLTREINIPVTTVARTLVDLASILPRHDLERAIEQAERLRIFDLTALERVLAGTRGRAGLSAINDAVQKARTPEPTREELERRFAAFCRAYGIPQPAINTWVEDFEVDAYWQAAKVIVELDGWEYHRTRAAFERDRLRDAKLELAGYRVRRVSWRWLRDEPEEVATVVKALLQAGLERHSATAAHG